MVTCLLRITISFALGFLLILSLFNLIPVTATKPNVDLIIVLVGFMIGISAYGFMEHYKVFSIADKKES